MVLLPPVLVEGPQVQLPRSFVRGSFDEEVEVTLQPWGFGARIFEVYVRGGSVRFDDEAAAGEGAREDADATVSISLLIEVPQSPADIMFEGNVICLPYARWLATTPREVATSAFEARVSPVGKTGYRMKVACLRYPLFNIEIDIPASVVPGLP